MARKYLGDGFDIHAGGLDLVFPHHEAEIAQAEGAGRRFARYWLHGNMLTVNGEKMSRSKGNFTTIERFFAEHDPMLLRFVFVQSHYRSIAEISPSTLAAAGSGLERLRAVRRELERRARSAPEGEDARVGASVTAARAAFERAMDDDFDTPGALAALFDLTRELNTALGGALPRRTIEDAARLFDDLGEGVLGLFPAGEADARGAERLEAVMGLLLEARAHHRGARDFARADGMRTALAEAGIEIEDAPGGARWTVRR
jgi:cysteinyl-tRNA synthetase